MKRFSGSAARVGREAFYQLLRLSGAPRLVRRRLKGRTTILALHNPSPEDMRRHLTVLTRHYTVVPLRTVVEARFSSSCLPSRPLVVTLDDAWAGNAALEPVFRSAGVVPTIFVCSGISGTNREYWWRWVKWHEAERMKALPDHERVAELVRRGFSETSEAPGASSMSSDELGHALDWADLQSHTRLHPILPMCDTVRAFEEIDGSRRDLEAALGNQVYALAYPNGDYGLREMRFAGDAGYCCALAVGGGFNDAKTNLYALKRIYVPDSASPAELLVRAAGIHDWILQNTRRRARK